MSIDFVNLPFFNFHKDSKQANSIADDNSFLNGGNNSFGLDNETKSANGSIFDDIGDKIKYKIGSAIAPGIKAKNTIEGTINFAREFDATERILDDIFNPDIETNVFETIKDLSLKYDDYKKNGYTAIDGSIGNSKQGHEGDCWLLASLNALSYDEKGQKILKDAVTKTENGYEVNFKGVNQKIEVSSDEIRRNQTNQKYSSGDDDVLLFEIATKKVMDMVREKTIKAPDFLVDTAKNSESSISGGRLRDFIYILTGDPTENKYNAEYINARPEYRTMCYEFPEKADLNSLYDAIEENPENICAVINFVGEKIYDDKSEQTQYDMAIAADIKDNLVVLAQGGHAWSLKSVEGDLVTIVNPWDSSEEIVFKKDEIEPYINTIEYYEYDKYCN